MKKLIRALILSAFFLLAPTLLTACTESRAITHTRETADRFSSIHLRLEDTDLCVLPAEDGKTRVEGALRRGRELTFGVEDGVLTVSIKDTRHPLLRLFTKTSAITLYLPEPTYHALTLSGTTGDVSLADGLAFSMITLDLSTGDVDCRADATEDLSVTLSTGDVTLSGLNAGRISVKGSTGATKLCEITAGGIYTKRSTGDVTLSAVSAARVTAVTSTGDIALSSVTADGEITAERTTGKATLTDVTAAALIISADTGRTTACGIRADAVTVTASTGDVGLSDLNAETLSVTTSTGDITLTRAVARGAMTLRASTGDVDLDRIDAAEMDIETSTGHVRGTVLSEKIFHVRTRTGSINVPETASGGVCRIKTGTGSVRISVAE